MSNLLYPLGSPSETPNAITSYIDGAFTGWAGGTIYRLRNGQIWQQTDYSYRYRYAYMPAVQIVFSRDGFQMIVEGSGAPIPVRRLR